MCINQVPVWLDEAGGVWQAYMPASRLFHPACSAVTRMTYQSSGRVGADASDQAGRSALGVVVTVVSFVRVGGGTLRRGAVASSATHGGVRLRDRLPSVGVIDRPARAGRAPPSRGGSHTRHVRRRCEGVVTGRSTPS